MAQEDENFNQGLLPAGLVDLLEPIASQNDQAITTMLNCFGQFGYQRVKPPLVEFESTLLAKGPGATTAAKSFRLMDPLTQDMMALRSDMTAQIARISGTRLKHEPRPLRLTYEGDVMRVVPDSLNSERQLYQAGAELIGYNDATATAEILVMGVKALLSVGLKSITVDLGVPSLAEKLLCNLSADQSVLAKKSILDKDIDALLKIDDKNINLIVKVMNASGSDGEALLKLLPEMSEDARNMIDDMLFVAWQLRDAYPTLPITFDPLEMRGFDYHTGVGFSIFAEGLRGEIARGGAYLTGFGEPATGLSVYMERVFRGLPEFMPKQHIYIPTDISKQTMLKYIDRGRCVIAGRYKSDDKLAFEEAKQLKCTFILLNSISPPEKIE